MKCDICERKVDKTIPFYYGFFKSEYEPEKWVNTCKECQIKFLQASNIYKIDRTPLIELEKNIKKKVRRR